jgi:hypothetical protein
VRLLLSWPLFFPADIGDRNERGMVPDGVGGGVGFNRVVDMLSENPAFFFGFTVYKMHIEYP